MCIPFWIVCSTTNLFLQQNSNYVVSFRFEGYTRLAQSVFSQFFWTNLVFTKIVTSLCYTCRNYRIESCEGSRTICKVRGVPGTLRLEKCKHCVRALEMQTPSSTCSLVPHNHSKYFTTFVSSLTTWYCLPVYCLPLSIYMSWNIIRKLTT